MKEFLPDNFLHNWKCRMNTTPPSSIPSPHTPSLWNPEYYLESARKLISQHLVYVRLLVTKAAKFKDDGWLAYDSILQQQNMAAGAPGI